MMANEDRKETTVASAPTAPTTPITPTPPMSGLDEEGGFGTRYSDVSNNNEISKADETVGAKDQPDFINVREFIEALNLNSYATRKTVAQAVLDLALLAANASQLKFILSVGERHEFYTLILWLVITSIVLQVVQAIMCIILGLILNINKVDEQKAADIVNNICLCVVVLITVVNIIITGFDIKGSDEIRGNVKGYL